MCMALYTKEILTCSRPCLSQSGAGFWFRFRFCVGSHKVLATSALGSSSLLGSMCGKGFGGPGGTPEHTVLGGPSSSPPLAQALSPRPCGPRWAGGPIPVRARAPAASAEADPLVTFHIAFCISHIYPIYIPNISQSISHIYPKQVLPMKTLNC